MKVFSEKSTWKFLLLPCRKTKLKSSLERILFKFNNTLERHLIDLIARRVIADGLLIS